MSTATEDWKKLTVPQLKALCKDKKITGYSKLGKNAIIQKLVEHVGSSNAVGSDLPTGTISTSAFATSSPRQVASSQIRIPTTSSTTAHVDRAPSPPEQHVKARQHNIDQDQIVPDDQPQKSSPRGLTTSVKPTNNDSLEVTSVTTIIHDQFSPAGLLSPSKKRPFEPSEPPATDIRSKHHKSLVSLGSSLSATLHPAFKVPAIPTPRKSISKTPAISPLPSRPIANVVKPVDPEVRRTLSLLSSHAPSKITTVKRFVPPSVKNTTSSVVLSAPCIVQRPLKVDSPAVAPSLQYLEFLAPRQLSLESVSFPPSLSQRKQVTRLAILLSGIPLEQLKECFQVSRLFRYAAYISAVHRLSRSFPGCRLDLVLSQYSPKMTNMWPYLQQRRKELLERQRIYRDSFLGRAVNQHRISERLWTSPDNPKQATVAVRFVRILVKTLEPEKSTLWTRFLLTWLYFTISIGIGVADFGVVIDTQELVEGELWSITTRSSSSTKVLYVLEATCEVVGHPPSSSHQVGVLHTPDGRIPLRADWSAYIEGRVSRSSTSGRTPLIMEHLKWTNHEEYERGISKLWIRRIQNEGELGAAKLRVAERYVLACVVGNSVSGRWMSSSEMAQEFNGLPSRTSSSRSNLHVHLFLPAHHHVESLHFTSSNGRPLHPALAAVQTPGREYYILRDNGMQLGCEEEGVASVWRGLLGCDALGRLSSCTINS